MPTSLMFRSILHRGRWTIYVCGCFLTVFIFCINSQSIISKGSSLQQEIDIHLENVGLLVGIRTCVGGQCNTNLSEPGQIDPSTPLLLQLDTLREGIWLFDKQSNICNTTLNPTLRVPTCFDPQSHTHPAMWCHTKIECSPLQDFAFDCVDAGKSLDRELFYRYSVLKNSLLVLEDVIEGYDTVNIPNVYPSNATKTKWPIKLLTERLTYNKTDVYVGSDGFDGILGTAGAEASCRDASFWDAMLQFLNIKTIAIDINFGNHIIPLPENLSLQEYALKPPDDESQSSAVMHLNSNLDKYGTIVWSERKQTGGIFQDALPSFHIFNLKMCNAHLFGQHTASWQAMIDTSSPCLTLPYEIWKSITTWLNLNIDHDCIINSLTFENKLECLPSVDKDRLPVFTIGLSQFAYNDIELPLSSLVVMYKNENRLCILPNYGTYEYSMGLPSILFGTLTLSSLYTVVDIDAWKIGFASKKSVKNLSAENCCSSPLQCIGDQTYNQQLNTCIDPSCSRIYFLSFLDPTTKKCTMPTSIIYFIIFFFCLLAVFDFSAHCLYRYAVFKAQHHSR